MKLCIFGRDDDATSTHIAARARARGYDVVRVPFSRLHGVPPATFAFDGTSWWWEGTELSTCEAFVLRQLPSRHALLAPPDENDTAANWYRRGKEQVARASAAESLVLDLERIGKPMVNPLRRSAPFDDKPFQLAVFRSAGLPVPETLITNDIVRARGFHAAARTAGQELVVKPVAGGAATRLVDDDVWATLTHGIAAPAIFQHRARGLDVRVTIVGGRVLSSVSVQSDVVDLRAAESWRRGAIELRACPLPPHVAAMSLRAADLCGHVISGLDWKLDETSNNWVLLEANSAPVYLEVERTTGAPITDAVLDWLEERARIL